MSLRPRQRTIWMGLVIALLAIISAWFISKMVEQENARLSLPISDKLAVVHNQSPNLIRPDSSGQIYLVYPDGSRQKRLVDLPGWINPVSLQWTPDGKQLAYTVGDLLWDEADLYVLNADGTGNRLLRRLPPNTSWTLSPDSQYVLYHGCTASAYNCLTAVVHIPTGQDACGSNYSPPEEISKCNPFKLSNGKWWPVDDSPPILLDEYIQRWALAPVVDQFLPANNSSVATEHFLSPDGKYVAALQIDNSTDQATWYIAQSDGTALRAVATFDKKEACPHIGWSVWSADSTRFVFSTVQDQQAHLWLIRADGDSASLLTRVPGNQCPEYLAWNDSGQHFSFFTSQGGTESKTGYVVDWPDGHLQMVGQGKSLNMSWAPAKESLLVNADQSSIWDANTHQAIPVDNEFKRCQWSPHGTWLGCVGANDVGAINITTGERYTARITGDRVLAWSPSGRWLAIGVSDYGYYEHLYIFDTVTKRFTTVTDRVEAFAWSPQ
jgi:Tol biopolymer transport system component